MGFIAGLIIVLAFIYLSVSVVCLIKPLPKLGIPTRGRAFLGIFLAFGMFIVGGAILPEDASNSESTSANTQRATQQPAGPVVSNVSFEQVNDLFGVSSNLTDLQKDARWEDFSDLCVEWTGELAYLDSGIFGGLSIGMKHRPTTFTYDVLLDAPGSQSDYFMTLQQGQSYTYRATLKNYGGAILPISADWGCE